jgi:hypothetical protein
MAGLPPKTRTVRRSDLFEQFCKSIEPDTERLDEILRGVEWAIATRAEVFPLLPFTALRMAKTDPYPRVKALRILFTIDDEDTCTLQYIERIEELPEEEDCGEVLVLRRSLSPCCYLSPPFRFPIWRRLVGSAWRYRANAGDPVLAADGNVSTAWVVPRRLNGDEFWEVTFDSPVPVSGVVLRLRRDSNFPTRFKIGARHLKGRWLALGFFDRAHVRQLLEQLLVNPRSAALGFDLGGELRTGLILMIDEGGGRALVDSGDRGMDALTTS